MRGAVITSYSIHYTKLYDVSFPEDVHPVEKDMTTTIVSVHAPRIEEVAVAAPEEAPAVEAAEGASVAEPEEKEE